MANHLTTICAPSQGDLHLENNRIYFLKSSAKTAKIIAIFLI